MKITKQQALDRYGIDVDDIPDDDKVSDKLRFMVDAMIVAVPTLDRQTATHMLLHTAHGRRLAEHLNIISKGEQPMDRISELKDIAKVDGGMVMIAKQIIDKGSTTISEHEYSAALMEFAKGHRQNGESVAKAFSRLLEEEGEIRTAYGIAKGYPNMMSIEPIVVSGTDAFDTSVADSSKKAYDALVALAEKQRALAPTLTDAQLFARVFEQNPDLAAKAHRRPTAS